LAKKPDMRPFQSNAMLKCRPWNQDAPAEPRVPHCEESDSVERRSRRAANSAQQT
jgi:hypothetical protein